MNNSRILNEWLDAKGNKVTLNNNTSAATTAGDYTNKFKKVVEQLQNTFSATKIIKLEPDLLYATFGPNNGYLHIRTGDNLVDFDCFAEYKFLIYIEHTLRIMLAPARYECNSWDEVLDILVKEKVISNKTLCESVSFSTIDDYKLYENLWN
jgi:hypothetical protein